MLKAGPWGAAAAFLGFTTPSFIFLVSAALYGSQLFGPNTLHMLKIAAWAIVAHALILMAPKQIKGNKAILAAIACISQLLFPEFSLAILLAAAAWGILLAKSSPYKELVLPPVISARFAKACALILLGLLLSLPFLHHSHSLSLRLFEIHAHIGSLVFGGGHVVLALLQSNSSLQALLGSDQILTAYALGQMLPGPLFTIAAFIGAKIHSWPGALCACIGIFLPGYLVLCIALPFWSKILQHPMLAKAVEGLSAGVFGLLLAIWIQPLGLSTITNLESLLWGISFFLLLMLDLPAWLIVGLSLLATL